MRADGPRWSAARCAIPDIQVRSDHPRVGFRRASIEYRIAECGSHSRKMFHNMPYANQCYLPDKSRLGPTRGGSNSPPGDAWGPGGAGTSQPAFQMRRRANAALATDQAARKPARMMSATFQASLFLGPRCGSIGGMALRTRMTAINMPVADATAACTGVAKGNTTVRTSDKVITSPRRHNPRRRETKRSTRFVSRQREAHFVSILSASKSRDISMHALRYFSSATMGRLDQDHSSPRYVCRPGRASQFAARPAGLQGEHSMATFRHQLHPLGVL